MALDLFAKDNNRMIIDIFQGIRPAVAMEIFGRRIEMPELSY